MNTFDPFIYAAASILFEGRTSLEGSLPSYNSISIEIFDERSYTVNAKATKLTSRKMTEFLVRCLAKNEIDCQDHKVIVASLILFQQSLPNADIREINEYSWRLLLFFCLLRAQKIHGVVHGLSKDNAPKILGMDGLNKNIRIGRDMLGCMEETIMSMVGEFQISDMLRKDFMANVQRAYDFEFGNSDCHESFRVSQEDLDDDDDVSKTVCS